MEPNVKNNETEDVLLSAKWTAWKQKNQDHETISNKYFLENIWMYI